MKESSTRTREDREEKLIAFRSKMQHDVDQKHTNVAYNVAQKKQHQAQEELQTATKRADVARFGLEQNTERNRCAMSSSMHSGASVQADLVTGPLCESKREVKEEEDANKKNTLHDIDAAFREMWHNDLVEEKAAKQKVKRPMLDFVTGPLTDEQQQLFQERHLFEQQTREFCEQEGELQRLHQEAKRLREIVAKKRPKAKRKDARREYDEAKEKLQLLEAIQGLDTEDATQNTPSLHHWAQVDTHDPDDDIYDLEKANPPLPVLQDEKDRKLPARVAYNKAIFEQTLDHCIAAAKTLPRHTAQEILVHLASAKCAFIAHGTLQ